MITGKPITLARYKYLKGKRTLGALYPTPDDPLLPINPTGKEWLCWTMEPDRDVSRENIPGSDTAIPEGDYEYKVISHPHFTKGPILMLTALDPKVKRGGLLMHPGNHDSETLGCVLPGLTRNADGEVFNSREAMRAVIEYVTGEADPSKQFDVTGILTIKGT